MIIAILIILGLAFGSFVNAYVWRLHEQSLPAKKRKASEKDLSILKGRSMCVHCGHTLNTMDLLPVVSWLALRGKCRYCKKPISWQYPLVEVSAAILFVVSYLSWPDSLSDTKNIFGFVVWLVAVIAMLALLVYDIRWMILPNKIIFPLTILIAVAIIIDAIFISKSFSVIVNSVYGALVGGGLFYVLFQLSNGRWIGGGDVKLGFMLGLLVGSPVLALLFIFIASLLGTLTVAPLMVTKKLKPHARIPFGPYLIVGAIITGLYGQTIVDAYMRAISL